MQSARILCGSIRQHVRLLQHVEAGKPTHGETSRGSHGTDIVVLAVRVAHHNHRSGFSVRSNLYGSVQDAKAMVAAAQLQWSNAQPWHSRSAQRLLTSTRVASLLLIAPAPSKIWQTVSHESTCSKD